MEGTELKFDKLEVGKTYEIGHNEPEFVKGVLRFKGRKFDTEGIASFEVEKPNNFMADDDGLISFDIFKYPPPLRLIV